MARTFAAQLRLIEQYPEYRFLQNQPMLYDLCKQHYPALFERIKVAIKKGGWGAEGAMWVQPDTNMTSGESLVCQLVYGVRYFKEELGVDCEILWLPDTFGYHGTAPDLKKLRNQISGDAEYILVLQRGGAVPLPLLYLARRRWQRSCDSAPIASTLIQATRCAGPCQCIAPHFATCSRRRKAIRSCR